MVFVCMRLKQLLSTQQNLEKKLIYFHLSALVYDTVDFEFIAYKTPDHFMNQA